MSVSQLNTVVNSETNNYYDVILFAAELAPKNDFSLEYTNGKVNFDNLSIECLNFFLNRFKNFDIFPSRLTVSKNGNNIELNSIDIYENCTKNLKLERPINRCTNVTLEILTCIQFLLDIFNGLIFSLIIDNTGDYLELCGITSECLTTIVEKMRQFQIIPKKIHFSSKSNLHIIFNRDSLFLLTAFETATVAVNGGESSRNNSFMSTEDFPISHESIRSAIIDNRVKSVRVGDRIRSKTAEIPFLEGEVDNNLLKAPRKMRKVREKKESGKSDTFLCLKEKKKKIKTKKTAKSATNVSVTKIKKPRQKRLSKMIINSPPQQQNVMMNMTDIDSGLLNVSNWSEFQQKQKVFLDETINSILNQDQLLLNNNNSIAPPFIKEEATVSSTVNNNERNKARLIFTSNPNSNSTLIYSSSKSSANNNNN